MRRVLFVSHEASSQIKHLDPGVRRGDDFVHGFPKAECLPPIKRTAATQSLRHATNLDPVVVL